MSADYVQLQLPHVAYEQLATFIAGINAIFKAIFISLRH